MRSRITVSNSAECSSSIAVCPSPATATAASRSNARRRDCVSSSSSTTSTDCLVMVYLSHFSLRTELCTFRTGREDPGDFVDEVERIDGLGEDDVEKARVHAPGAKSA